MAIKQGSILIVDDDEDILAAGKLLLKRHFSKLTTCNRPEFIPELMANQQFDAILLDMNFSPGESSGAQGYQWLDNIMSIDPQAVVIMITAHGGVNVAVEAMKRGATDYIPKPWQNEKLVATLSAAVQLGQSRSETKNLKQTNKLLAEISTTSFSKPIIGDSVAMQQVHSLIDRAAPTDANVLILGENGTGKELIARALHSRSHRSDKVFMSVDLGALSETLFESELFGHKKGAFTDARDDRIGRLQAADGGTLFLDEIGNIPLHLQAKLLSVLEQREVTPLGSNQSVAFDVRVIAATNMPVEKLRREDHFRQDLLFRLNTVEIPLPPLRDRRDDIPAIANHYLMEYGRKYGKTGKSLSPAAASAITAYHWPGNVRALRHAVERAIVLAEGAQIEASDFQLDQSTLTQPITQPMTQQGGSAVESAETVLDAGATIDALTGEGCDLNLERIEKNTIEAALKKHRFNISHAAKELGLTRAALYRRMEKHGL